MSDQPAVSVSPVPASNGHGQASTPPTLSTALFFELSRDLLCMAGTDGYFRQINPAFEHTLGWSRAELLSRPFLDFVHPDDVPATLAEVARLAEGAPTIYFENRYQCQDGSYKWLAWTSQPTPEGMLYAIARDITERREQEAILQAALAQADQQRRTLQAILDNLPVGVFVADAQTGVPQLVNRKGIELLGRGVDPQRGKDDYAEVYQTYLPDSSELFPTQDLPLVRAMTTGEVAHREVDIQRPDSRITVDVIATPIRDAADHIISAVALFQDITQRRQSERELQQSREQYALAVQGTNDGVWDWDIRTNQVYFSPRWKSMIGYAEHELLNGFADFEALLHPDDHDRVLGVVDQYVRGALDVYDVEFRFHHKDGSYRWIRARGQVLRDAEGRPYRMAGSHTEITEQKETEVILAKRAEELAVVAQVGAAAAQVLDPLKLLQTVVELAKSAFNLYHAHVYLLDDAGTTLELAAGAGQVGATMVAQGWKIPLDREQSLVARAARTKQGVRVNDVREAPDFLPNPLLPETRAELAVPVMLGAQILGVLDVQSNNPGYFTDEDVQIQTTLASQIAVALQNARQFAEARRLADREALVNAINQQIQSTTTVESALQIAARELGRALKAQRAVVQLGQASTVSKTERLDA